MSIGQVELVENKLKYLIFIIVSEIDFDRDTWMS